MTLMRNSTFAAAVLVCVAAPLRSAETEWPQFRGPTGQGLATATGLPTEWSTTKNVVWKQSIPGHGWSSPVVSRGRVFLTTGEAVEGRGLSLRTICLDSSNGEVVWSTEVFAPPETTT